MRSPGSTVMRPPSSASVRSGMAGLLSMMRGMWSWSVCAAVRAVISSYSRIVAAGPVLVELAVAVVVEALGIELPDAFFAFGPVGSLHQARIDGDGQHEVEDIPKVLEPIVAGRADAVIGSRFLGETVYRGSIPRIFGIQHFRWLVNLFTGYRVTDPTSGFFAINRRLIEFYSEHYPSDYPEVDAYILMHRLGARAEEVPVRMHARAEGKSSITTFKAVYYMVKVTLSFLINRIRRFG